jgi:dTDP-4-amino-4,6-dideoxygalactose transaminase
MFRQVPFFNYPFLYKSKEQEILSIFQDVCSRGAYILQKDLVSFEQNLAKYTGAKYALGVANGTDAIWLSLMAAGIGKGDEVIFCSHTYIATAGAIHFAGATPVPVECGYDNMIDPEAVRKAVTSKTKAIMPTQVNGRTANMDALQAIADEYGLLIVEDAAQGLGSKYKGKQAGTFGIGGTISFYPAKTLGSLGDGGAILTSDDEFYEKICLLRDHGRNDNGEFVMWGFNSRLDNLQGAILDFKLSYYDDEIRRRREVASLYQQYLGDVSELGLPVAPDAEPDHFDVYQNYEIRADKRDDLKTYLKENGVGTLIQWSGQPVHTLKNLGFDMSLPYTESFFEKCLMIPMNTALSNDDVAYVSEKIRAFYGR